MPRSAIMITRSRRLSLKLVYQATHKMMICPSKCRPLNRSSIGTNRCISSSSPASLAFAPELAVVGARGHREPGMATLCPMAVSYADIKHEFDMTLGYIHDDIRALCAGTETVNYTVALVIGVACEALEDAG